MGNKEFNGVIKMEIEPTEHRVLSDPNLNYAIVIQKIQKSKLPRGFYTFYNYADFCLHVTDPASRQEALRIFKNPNTILRFYSRGIEEPQISVTEEEIDAILRKKKMIKILNSEIVNAKTTNTVCTKVPND